MMHYLLPHSVKNASEKSPGKIAFTDGERTLTYAQLNAQMNQLANWLIELGLQKGDRVGIYLNRCLESAVAMYGIMQAGGVYVPIDPKSSTERVQFLIEDCTIKILITQSAQKRRLIKVCTPQLPLQTIIGVETEEVALQTFNWEDLLKQPATFVAPYPILEQDLAYIIYTSGSTGEPKGIMHSHFSGLAYARLTAHTYAITPDDRLGNHAPIHFDISTLGYLTGPFVGATTVIVSDAHTIFPLSLIDLMAKEKLTIWYSVPLALIQFLQSGALAEKNWNHLRWVLYGGEACSPSILQDLMQHWSQAKFSNVYGPAEVNQCTCFNLSEIPIGIKSIPIGRVWENTEYLILDENEEVVADEIPGELLIRSATMMKGYWNKPELTKRAFYKLPGNLGYDKVFYRTGDLVKQDAEGNLHFLGRIDHQVKIRGYRVELDAIEILLCSHEAVAEAAVVPIRTDGNVQSIEAAVLLQPNMAITEKELHIFLKQKLPAHSIPGSIKILEDFPRSSNGKIQRKALLPILQNSTN